MSFIKTPHTICIFYTVLFMLLCIALPCARAEETEDTIELFNAWQGQSTSATRAPKPLSQTAENITVITTSEIEALNAHTLADVLSTVTGLQIQQLGGPGSIAFTSIQGSSAFHTLVLLDGVPLNNSENFADVALVPARIIERIEIVKGSASSSWGQALGGVINIVTKRPDTRPVGGTVSASIGERTTADTGAELTGSSGRVGYYLSGGYLGSSGLLPERQLFSNYAYGKLTYDLPGQGQVWGTINYTRAARGDNFSTLLDYKEGSQQYYLYATLGLRRPLTERLELELNAYYAGRDKDDTVSILSDNSLSELNHARDRVGGASAKLVWRGERQLLVGGFEYEHDTFNGTSLLDQTSLWGRKMDRYGFYLNDTISIGRLTVIPGARFDKTANGNQFSPSLGATLRLGENNLLRAYAGRGYGFAVREKNWNVEKIWTVQVGMESSSIPYLWLKGTLFRNETWNVLNNRNLDPSVPERRIALGAEIEARTLPVFNTTLGAGYTFVDTTHSADGSQVYAVPRHTVQLSLRYDDRTYRGVLTGRHIMWNAVPGYGGSYGGLIWDLHLGATLLKRENNSLEVFFSGHNLFDGAQYPDETQPNTGRWFEGGMRVRF
jgi:vitamin B12 transporter